MPTQSKEFWNDTFYESSAVIKNTTEGAFIGIANEFFLLDAQRCFNYSAILFWNGIDAVKYTLMDPYLAVESFGLIMHKSPLVYFQCFKLISDFKYAEYVFLLLNNYNAKNYWNQFFHIYENFFFNIGDVILQLMNAQSHLEKRMFYEYGLSIGRITADLFYHNPYDQDQWPDNIALAQFTPEHSEKIESKYVHPEVKASRPSLDNMAQSLLRSINRPAKKVSHKFSVSSMRNPMIVEEENFLSQGPRLKLEDKDMPLIERLRKSISLKTRKNMEMEQLKKLEEAIENL